MSTENKIILVFGATGRQGGATARHLIADGWQVRALTRDPDQPAAQELRNLGADVVKGQNEDRASLEAAMRGVYGVFSIQAYLGNEVEQGKLIADVAKAAGVQHFVYTSVQNAEALANVGGEANKWQIEQHLHALGLPATILRPPFFMETLLAPRTDVPDDTARDTFTIGIKPDVPMGLIAVDDIGAFAVLAFAHPDQYVGKTIEIAGDVKTPMQVVAAISQAIGRPFRYVQVPVEAVRQQSPAVAHALDYLNAAGYAIDLEALRRQHSALMSLETWLDKVGKAAFAITA